MLPVAYPSLSHFNLSERQIRYPSCVTSLLERQTSPVGTKHHSFLPPEWDFLWETVILSGSQFRYSETKGGHRCLPLQHFTLIRTGDQGSNQRTEEAKGTKGKREPFISREEFWWRCLTERLSLEKAFLPVSCRGKHSVGAHRDLEGCDEVKSSLPISVSLKWCKKHPKTMYIQNFTYLRWGGDEVEPYHPNSSHTYISPGFVSSFLVLVRLYCYSKGENYEILQFWRTHEQTHFIFTNSHFLIYFDLKKSLS